MHLVSKVAGLALLFGDLLAIVVLVIIIHLSHGFLVYVVGDLAVAGDVYAILAVDIVPLRFRSIILVD